MTWPHDLPYWIAGCPRDGSTYCEDRHKAEPGCLYPRCAEQLKFVRDDALQLAPFQQFCSVRGLLEFLPSAQAMLAKYSGLNGLPFPDLPGERSGIRAMKRVPEEARNVQISCYIRAANTRRFADSDYHVLLADTPDQSPPDVMVAEVKKRNYPETNTLDNRTTHVSSAADNEIFHRMRSEFDALFDGWTDVGDTPWRIPPDGSLKVNIRGSLFLDIDHLLDIDHGPDQGGDYAGSMPTCRRTTVWEIHPVHSIKLRP